MGEEMVGCFTSDIEVTLIGTNTLNLILVVNTIVPSSKF
jgi:hypothetical protein